MLKRALATLLVAIAALGSPAPTIAHDFGFQVLPPEGFDFSLETRFEVESDFGNFAIVTMLPEHAVCPKTNINDGGATCNVNGLARIEGLESGFSVSHLAVVGQVLDENLEELGYVATTIRPLNPKSHGYKTTYRRLTFAFEKDSSGFVTHNFNRLISPNSSLKVRQIGADAKMKVTILDNKDYIEFVGDQQDKVVKKLESLTFKTICRKGKVTKAVNGKPGTCPKGFTNPLKNERSYQAFLGCKLFNKGNVHTSAQLISSGKKLQLRLYDYSTFSLEDFWGTNLEVTKEDFECVLSTFRVSRDIAHDLSQACGLSKSGEFKLSSNHAIRYSCDPRYGQTIVFG